MQTVKVYIPFDMKVRSSIISWLVLWRSSTVWCLWVAFIRFRQIPPTNFSRSQYAWYCLCSLPSARSTSPCHSIRIDSSKPLTTSTPSALIHQLVLGCTLLASSRVAVYIKQN